MAQPIDISLHPTAVPDSFEVRLTSATVYDGLPNGTFTIRWEVTAGGVANNTDVSAACGGYSFANYGGTVDVLDHRYFTINFFGDRPLSQSGCAITPDGMSLGGVRIRELSGCRNVELVSNAFVDLSNFAYYISIGGNELTGAITSVPLSSGDCPPCEAPMITDIGASPIPYCGEGGDLWVDAMGTTPDYAWYDADGELLTWLPDAQGFADGAGTYVVVVSNACGADTAQIETVLDLEFCTPPVIDSGWVEPWQDWFGNPGISLHVASSGNCVTRTWTVPAGFVSQLDPEGLVYITTALDGTYTVVVSNACGADTLTFSVVVPEPCSGPNVVSATIVNENPCHIGTVQFHAYVSGPNPIITGWYGPDGALLTGAPDFTLPSAPWGTYTFVASNSCASDTATVYHSPMDTTGLADCVPPQIISTGPEIVSCMNDTVQLISSVVLNGPCSSLTWSGVSLLSAQNDTVLAVLTNGWYAPVILTATNACGQAIDTVPISVLGTGQYQYRQCGINGPFSMDSLLYELFQYENGEWLHSGLPHSGMYDPAIDTTGHYLYYIQVSDGSSCLASDLRMYEYPEVYAGEDAAILVCGSDPPFPMFPTLGGEPEPGGSWTYAGQATNSEFDPVNDPSGIYTYRRSVQYTILFSCTDDAELTVDVLPSSSWYADPDGDGLGNPDHSLEACDQPAGFVNNATDACPDLFGTVGDPCDDGDSATENDVITVDCECVGENSNGMSETEATTPALWPNPNSIGALFLRLPTASGQAYLTISDATGRVVLRDAVPASSRPVEVQLPIGLATGSYCVGIVTDKGAWTRRLVVAH